MNSERSRQKIVAILVGILFMVIAIILQMIVQAIPSILLVLEYGLSRGARMISEYALSNMIIYSLFIGGTAAVFQEAFKYLAVDTRRKTLAIWIGLGFSVVDIAFLFGETYPSLRAELIAPTILLLLIVLNAASSLLFHPGTAMFLKSGILRGRGILYLPFAIFLHGVIDGGLVYTDLFVKINPGSYLTAIGIYWTVVMAISIWIFIYGYRNIKASSEERKAEAVVY